VFTAATLRKELTELPYLSAADTASSADGSGYLPLNERGVPCPSSADLDRNRHRTRGAWTLRTVAVILANPPYIGQQTWNRRATGSEGPASMPALSAKTAHPPLVTEQDFVAAQRVQATTAILASSPSGLIHFGVCNPTWTRTGTTGNRRTAAATATPALNARASLD
jgi:hypothetical protein